MQHTTGEGVTLQLYLQRQGNGEPLVILHGLFGSFDNWGSVSKRLSAKAEFNLEVISLDLRNHGNSPHTAEMSYASMADDVAETLIKEGVEHYHLLGHSMGGKVAMTLAQQPNDRRHSKLSLRSLIVVDIAPRQYQPTHLEIIAALQTLDLNIVKSRSDANERLSDAIPSLEIRQFILKNLYRDQQGAYAWKLNLAAIAAAYDALLVNPLSNDTAPCDTPTLLIRGADSNYVAEADLTGFRHYFPALSIHTVAGAGHWPHASHTQETMTAITTFLNGQQQLRSGI